MAHTLFENKVIEAKATISCIPIKKRSAERTAETLRGEDGAGAGMIANTIKLHTGLDDIVVNGKASIVGKIADICVLLNDRRGVRIGADAGPGTTGANFDDATGDGLTQLITLHSHQGFFIFDSHIDLPAFCAYWILMKI